MEPKELKACLVKAGVVRHISPVLIRNVTKWWILRSCWNTATGNELWHKSYGPWGPNCIPGNYGTEKRNDPCNPLKPKSRVKFIHNAQKRTCLFTEFWASFFYSPQDSTAKMTVILFIQHNQRFCLLNNSKNYSYNKVRTRLTQSLTWCWKLWSIFFQCRINEDSQQQKGAREGTETKRVTRITVHPCKDNTK